MSRSYRMAVTVRGYDPERIGEICGALHAQWDFDPGNFPLDVEQPPTELCVSGVDYLYAGLADNEMAQRLARAVWAANNAYCEVEVRSTYLDAAPPSDIHAWDTADYSVWLQTKGGVEE